MKNIVDLDGEIWAKIDGVDGGYISNMGRAKSITKFGERILKYQYSKRVRKKGNTTHIRVMFDRRRATGKAHYIGVAMCVAKYFIKDNGDFKQIIHRDGDYTNCSSDNLMYKHDFNAIATTETLLKYSTFESPIGIAVYQYCMGNKEFIYTEIEKLRVGFVRILKWSGGLCESDAEEAFWLGITKFIQKIPNGFLSSGETIEGLLITSCKFQSLVIASNHYKSQSMMISVEDNDFNFMDTQAYSDIEGNTHYYEDEYAGINNF